MNRQLRTDEELTEALAGMRITDVETVDYPVTDGLLLTGTKPDGTRIQVEISTAAPWEEDQPLTFTMVIDE